jgi:DNA-binding PadR family transcriptional regulator
MQEIGRKTEGVWKPSPGSVYFLMKRLNTEGLLIPMPHSPEKKYLATKKAKDEIARTHSELKSLLAWNLQLLEILVGFLDPTEAERLKLMQAVAEAPTERLSAARAALAS